MQPRQRIGSGSPYEPSIGFSRALRVGDRVLVSGTAPVWPDGSCDPDPEVQARRCLEIILAALREAGAGPEHVVRTRTYLTAAGLAEVVGRVHGEVFGEIRPASTMVVVAALLDPRWKVELEAEAVAPAPLAPARAETPGSGADPFIRQVIVLSVANRDLLNEQLVRAHVAHLKRLEDQGLLELCGPFCDKKGGMVVLRNVSEQQARAIAQADPFVASGAETYELRTLELSCRDNNHMGMG